MSSLLLDTNALIFSVTDADRLPDDLREEIACSEDVSVSDISFLEIGIKRSVGRLELLCSVMAIEKICRMMGFRFVHLHNVYIDELMNVPKMEDHKDPFDRLLIAQARLGGYTLVTCDRKIERYKRDYAIETRFYEKR